MMFVFTPSTLDKNSGRMLMTISLEMSMKKLVRLTAHTFRGSDFSLLFECLTAGSVSPIPDNLSRNSPKKTNV
jgi:hypothetical protein